MDKSSITQVRSQIFAYQRLRFSYILVAIKKGLFSFNSLAAETFLAMEYGIFARAY